MALSLTGMRNVLLPWLDDVGRRTGARIECHVGFETDELMIRVGDAVTRISRYEMEDGKHIAKLQIFKEALMCASKGSIPVTSPQSSELARAYQTAQSAVQDNMYKQAFGSGYNSVQQVAPEPKAHEPEPTVEDLKRRHERKLDLSD